MANIDMEHLEKCVKKSEEEIVNGKVIEFEEAMTQIHREFFIEDL